MPRRQYYQLRAETHASLQSFPRLPPIAITAPPNRQRTTPTADGYLSANGPPVNATNRAPMIAALPTRPPARRVVSVVGVGATDD